MRTEKIGDNYWIVSVPRDQDDEQGDNVVSEMETKLLGKNFCQRISKFDVPNFRIGTYDSLMTLSDELKKVDTYVEAQLKKIANQFWKVTDKKTETVIPIEVNKTQSNPEEYLNNFIWESGHYSVRKPLSELTETIQAEVGKIEEDLRIKTQAYSSVEQILNKATKDESGSLLTKDLTNILKNFQPIETEYMTTVFVVVPRNDIKTFENSYETFTEYVVPRSATPVADDDQFTLFSVVTFKQFVEDFKVKARKMKFTVRKHEPNLSLDNDKKEELAKQLSKRKKDLQRFCKANYAEVFMAWVHLKAIRIYVESVLRFGLPARFRAVVIEPSKKNEKKLRKALDDMYKDLLGQEVGEIDTDDKNAITLLGNEEFFAYVFLEMFIEHNPAVKKS
jgi:V-type H+-transporting ATPase subunit C